MTLWQLTALLSFECRIVKEENPRGSAETNLLFGFYKHIPSEHTQWIYGENSRWDWTINQLKSCHEKKCVAPQCFESFPRFLSTFKKSICNCWSTPGFPFYFFSSRSREFRERTLLPQFDIGGGKFVRKLLARKSLAEFQEFVFIPICRGVAQPSARAESHDDCRFPVGII